MKSLYILNGGLDRGNQLSRNRIEAMRFFGVLRGYLHEFFQGVGFGSEVAIDSDVPATD